MARRSSKTVLFLCTVNYYRSRFAEILFNSVAARMGLAWKAGSRGLALERGVSNIGPMDPSAIQKLQNRGLYTIDAMRSPLQVTLEDLENAQRIIAIKEVVHRPLLIERFPTWADKVEYWHIDDAPHALELIEREVMELTARLLGGGNSPQADDRIAKIEKSSTPAPAKLQSLPIVRLGRQTKGRRGKGVTIVADVPLDESGLHELAATLKQRCGTGGTVKDGHIEIQGDQRERLTTILENMGYKVKRMGG